MENCLDYPELQEALASLPDTLDETYARILNAIPSRHKQTAIRILQFLAFSERPLKIEEVVEIIAVDPKGDPRFDPRNRMPESKEISRYCSSLVAVERRRTSEFNQTMVTELQLSHFSVKEYLTSNRLEKDLTPSFQEISAKASIATICPSIFVAIGRRAFGAGNQREPPIGTILRTILGEPCCRDRRRGRSTTRIYRGTFLPL